MEQKNKKPHYIGHRKRLREKFMSHPDGVQNYELIEMLLFYVFTRKDTKETAKSIYSKFKTLREVIFANVDDLKNIEELGESSIHLITLLREIFSRILLERIKDKRVIKSSNDVYEYYQNILGNEKKEQLRIMLLDSKNHLISEEIMQIGTINHTHIYPREIVQKALEKAAAAIILVHNHPSGDTKPSKSDILATKTMQEVIEKLDISLFDHIIIGKNEYFSFRKRGLLL